MAFDPNDWANKLKLTIDSSKVDGDLTDFPVLVTLSSSTGINGFDATSVFDELATISGCEWNPNDKNANITLSNGNLTYTSIATSWKSVRAIEGKSSGKWYWETTIDTSGGHAQIGVALISASVNTYVGQSAAGYSYDMQGAKWHSGGSAAYGSSFTTGDVVGIALDLDNGKIWWAKNGIWQASGNPAAGTNEAFSGLSGEFYPMNSPYETGNIATANFGVSAFSYSVPTGFIAGFIDNTKKIAITATVSGIETELYTEIERWGWANEQAWLWVKVPTISSGTDTNLHLYYDSTHTTNSGYIGDTGDAAAQNVWDDNFVGVWHLAQDPNGDAANCMLDSTSNVNNGTPAGAMTSDDLVDGKTGKAIQFDANDYINVPHNAVFNITDAITIELQAKVHTITPGNNPAFIAKDHATSWDCILRSGLPGSLGFYIGNSLRATTENNVITQDTWHYIIFSYDKNAGGSEEIKIYVDTQVKGTGDYDSNIGTDGDAITIAKYLTQYLDAIIDETRISKIDRSTAWKKTTYYSNWNNLITFSEVGATFTFTNPSPSHQSTVYGNSQTLQLTVTVSGEDPSYIYDATFYNATTSGIIGSTVSGTSSGQPASINWSTVDSGDYSWYVYVTSSGYNDTSSTYEFTKKYKCEGYVEIDGTRASGIPVRLYLRSDGELVGFTTSIGISGTFEIDTLYNENHYAIAIHPTDSETNALIYDWLTP